MKVGLDATLLAQPRIVGISRFIANLVDGLAAREAADEYYLYYRPRALKHMRLLRRPRHGRFHIRFLQEPFNRAGFRDLDVFHATYQRLPRYHDLTPYLGSLHDIYYLSRAEWSSSRTRRRWQERYRDVVARSRLIMTLSEYSRREIVRRLGAEPDRVRVVPLAAGAEYTPQPGERVAAVRSLFDLQAPYILFGGGLGRRKNLAGALQAFACAVPALPRDLLLAVAGAGRDVAQARSRAEAEGIGDRVRFLGFVPEEHFPALICGCLFFLFPTLFEGFGLPALEAMACGAPLLTAATTSLPEVCGDAALLVDPADTEALAEGIVRLSSSAGLRSDLRERGLRRAEQFSWSKATDAIHALYSEIAASS